MDGNILKRSTPIGKFWIERCVCAPQYREFSTSTTPIVSDSFRNGIPKAYRTGRFVGILRLGNYKPANRQDAGGTFLIVRIGFVSLFPEMIRPFIGSSIMGRAAARQLVAFQIANPRDFTYDRNNKVDDRPFGGAAGMLMKPEPVALALEHLGGAEVVIVTDPAAPLFDQSIANELSGSTSIAFLCGHYEGIDHRIRQHVATHAFSVGDYVLTNGELPALTMADAIIRQIPGVLGNSGSLEADSFSDGLLSAPNYTHPVNWRGHVVPDVLRSGDHAAIAKWRRQQSAEFTTEFRPDLLNSDPS